MGGGAFFMSLKATNSIQVVSLGDLFTCTQHWGISRTKILGLTGA